jgi:1-deoxy-D-xylulose-5-phosphate reductoisomerase
VELFLAGSIGFTDIARVVEKVLDNHRAVELPGLEEILAANAWAREEAARIFGGNGGC